MKRILCMPRETLGRTLTCLTRALLAALLAGARLFGGYAPFAVGMVGAAGAGWEGLCALIGAGLGALALLDFPHALRTTACCVLLFTANNAFCELRAYQKRWFLPALTAGLSLAVEAIYVVRAKSAAEAAHCALCILIAALFADECRMVFASRARRADAASLAVLVGVLTALASPQFQNGFAPGRIAAVLAVLLLAFERETAFALGAALAIGFALDLAAPEKAFAHVVCYGFGALATALLHRGSRVRAALAFVFSAVVFALPFGMRQGLMLVYEALAGTLVFLLLPSPVLRAIRAGGAAAPTAAHGDDLAARLRETAGALRELHESVALAEAPPEENPAVIFDRAAEAVCRDCPQRERCWEREYAATYHALSDAAAALLQNAGGSADDFPAPFAGHCARFPAFLAAVNGEVRAFLLRRQYRGRLEASYARSAGQYARCSELLCHMAERAAAVTTTPIAYRTGVARRAREGERVSGDCASTFETPDGALCLLVCDGMGSGEAARSEAALAARLVERLLRALVEPEAALRTLSGALSLRAERSESFTTVDLLTLSLKNGEGKLYKYGAAPSYVKRGARVRRVNCSCLPAGLADDAPPEATQLRIERGSFFVMVTDGVADAADDAWLVERIAAWEGENPQLLASAILADSCEYRGAADDALALVLYLGADDATEV